MVNLILDVLDRSKYYANTSKLFVHIVQVGTGATGGQLVQQISQMLSTFDLDYKYVIADADIVEEKNLKNQLFIKKDIGQAKAEVLARRYRAAYNVNIASYSEKYVEDNATLENLFNTDYSKTDYRSSYLPILIGAVDNKFTRKLFHEYFDLPHDNFIYIDVGNEGVELPGHDKPRTEWTEEEIKTYNNSGYTGQVVAGVKLKKTLYAKPLGTMFPDVLNIEESDIAPSAISCSDIVASEPQRLITNRYSALAVTTYLNELLSEGTISSHITYFHAKRMYMRTEPLTKN